MLIDVPEGLELLAVPAGSAARLAEALGGVLGGVRGGDGVSVVSLPGSGWSISAEPGRRGGGGRAGSHSAQIITVENDYLTVKLLDSGGNAVGGTINVAKPGCLRHVAANFPEADTITSNTSTSVTASATGQDDEEWEVRPLYQTVTPIEVKPVVFSGVTVSGADLKWLDCNGDARAWAQVTDETAVE